MKKSLQKILLSLMTLVLVFLAVPHITFSAAAADVSYLTADEAVEWLDSTIGTMRGDGHCVAFIKDYYQVLTGYVPSGDAGDYATNPLPSGFGWKRIKGETNLKKGDILIWTGGTGGNGHAAIYGGDGRYFHQKWSGKFVEVIGKSYVEGFRISRSGTYARYWGVVRPSFRSESMFTKISDSSTHLKNQQSGKYLSAESSSALAVKSLKSSKAKNQLFTFGKSKTGYTISPSSTSNVVFAAFETGKTYAGVSVNLRQKSDNDSCEWRLQKTSGAYVIRSVYNPTLCLTADKKSGKLTVEKYKGDKNQKWEIEAKHTVTYDANGGWSTPEKTTAKEGTAHKVSTARPNKTGSKFLGWSTTKKAKKATYLSGSSITPDKNTTLYAVWKKNKKYEIASVTLSQTTYTYDGQAKKPAVTVKDTNGNTLREGTDYKVKYSKGRTHIGKYKVTVTFTGNFKGKKTLYFSILPQATTITGMSLSGKNLTVKFKKQSKNISGYAVQYSTDKSFSEKNTKTVIVDNLKKTSKTLKNLTSGKKWYVRVCTVKEADGKTYYSKWSEKKSVKV
ncbi:MAG: InlB B-repeat-containing protein [Clostridia bacterium]|nr:InlB B-repeat-containing protein [Clostridia bacterium]